MCHPSSNLRDLTITIVCSFQIDSLDTLALLGDRERFATSVEWIGNNLQFDIVSLVLSLFLCLGIGVQSRLYYDGISFGRWYTVTYYSTVLDSSCFSHGIGL